MHFLHTRVPGETMDERPALSRFRPDTMLLPGESIFDRRPKPAPVSINFTLSGEQRPDCPVSTVERIPPGKTGIIPVAPQVHHRDSFAKLFVLWGRTTPSTETYTFGVSLGAHPSQPL